MKKTESSFSSFINAISSETGSLVSVNFCFILTSLPLFTFGASLLAMQKIIIKLNKGEKVHVFKTYFKLFKENFLNGLKLTLFIAVFSALFFFSTRFYIINSNLNEMYLGISILIICLFFIFFGMCTLVVLMYSYINLTLFQCIKNSFILYFGYFGKMLLITLSTLSIIAITLFLLPFSLPILVTLTFSVATLISTSFSYFILEDHIINKE